MSQSESQFMFLLFDLNRCDYSYNGTPKIFENVSLNRRVCVCVFHTLSLFLIPSAAFNTILSVVFAAGAAAAPTQHFMFTCVCVCVSVVFSHDRGEPYLTEWNIQSY